MGAGTECQTRIESDHDRIAFIDAGMRGADPKISSEAHRPKILQPLAFPGAIGDFFDVQGRATAADGACDGDECVFRCAVIGEDRLQSRRRPQTYLAGFGFEDRIVTPVGEDHRIRASLEKNGLDRIRVEPVEV